MFKKYGWIFPILVAIGAVAGFGLFWGTHHVAVLNPSGLVAMQERDLLAVATILMLIVVIPVFFFGLIFSWKYREGREGATYDPDFTHSHLAETIWWLIPCVIIGILSVMTWVTSHSLDPFKPLPSTDKSDPPLTIQAVALEWKWLFIYPEHNIATVNFIRFPENRQISFEITADAPMNSLWIPQMGSQIYAMPGMRTKLHLVANEIGNFRGSSANLSGTGFSGMTFTATADSEDAFYQWVREAQQSSEPLSMDTYQALAAPSSYNPVATYLLQEKNLFDKIVMKYMMPPQE
jgi:cytochrome o ubiquinol oxidase subunit 2